MELGGLALYEAVPPNGGGAPRSRPRLAQDARTNNKYDKGVPRVGGGCASADYTPVLDAAMYALLLQMYETADSWPGAAPTGTGTTTGGGARRVDDPLVT